jgi:RNA polymerase sigma-70 factor (ECF subfamily)
LEPDPPRLPAFESLYEQHFAFVWRSLRLLGVSRDALEDTAQETFAVVARRAEAFDGRSSVRTWIFAIARKTAANQRRTQRRKLSQLRPLDEPIPSPAPSPEAHAQAAEAAARVEAFCDTLDEDRRAIFVLALLEGVPAPELAPALGLPLNTVYSRIRALRQALERFLLTSEAPRDRVG